MFLLQMQPDFVAHLKLVWHLMLIMMLFIIGILFLHNVADLLVDVLNVIMKFFSLSASDWT